MNEYDIFSSRPQNTLFYDKLVGYHLKKLFVYLLNSSACRKKERETLGETACCKITRRVTGQSCSCSTVEVVFLVTRRVTGQSFVCRMVYIGMVFGFYMGTLSSRNTTQMAFCSSGVPKLRRRNAKCETPKMRNSGAKRPIFNLI